VLVREQEECPRECLCLPVSLCARFDSYNPAHKIDVNTSKYAS
jgi:hypothetical protein